MRDTKPEKDWPEDFDHENGMYYCKCMHCKELFIGYKRRVVCHECHDNQQKMKEVKRMRNTKEVMAVLQEECAEVIQAVSKVNRFGLESEWEGVSNKQSLITEIGE